MYIDDVILYHADLHSHISSLDEVLTRFSDAGLKLKPKKCFLLKSKVHFLGHVVSAEQPPLIQLLRDPGLAPPPALVM